MSSAESVIAQAAELKQGGGGGGGRGKEEGAAFAGSGNKTNNERTFRAFLFNKKLDGTSFYPILGCGLTQYVNIAVYYCWGKLRGH